MDKSESDTSPTLKGPQSKDFWGKFGDLWSLPLWICYIIQICALFDMEFLVWIELL